jgi:hypothetical protein
MNFVSNFEKIKSLVTDKKMMVRPLYTDMYEIEQRIEFMFTSNHENSFIIEESDRRYLVLQLSDKYQNNKKFFKELRDKSMNEDCANSFFTYLHTIKVEKEDLIDIPMTTSKEKMIANKKNDLDHFWEEKIPEILFNKGPYSSDYEDEKELCIPELDHEKIVKIPKNDLYKQYVDFSYKNNKVNNRTNFYNYINEKEGVTERKIKGIRYYLFDTETIKITMSIFD